jgi:hypothetical protein
VFRSFGIHASLSSAFWLCLALVFLPGSASAQSSSDQPTPVPSSNNQTSTKPSKPSQSPDVSKSTRVWTNENIGAVQGSISVVGGSSSEGDPHAIVRSHEVFHGVGTIVSPPDGSIVAPGEIMHIEVSAPPGSAYKFVAIVSPLGFSDVAKSLPYVLTLKVPSDVALRTESITVLGAVEGKNGEPIAQMTVDVERPDMPRELWSDWKHLIFGSPGEEIHLTVGATFADGQSYDATESSFVKYRSADPKIATVNEDGLVRSVGPGETWVWAIYEHGTDSVKLSIRVNVTQSAQQNSLDH